MTEANAMRCGDGIVIAPLCRIRRLTVRQSPLWKFLTSWITLCHCLLALVEPVSTGSEPVPLYAACLDLTITLFYASDLLLYVWVIGPVKYRDLLR